MIEGGISSAIKLISTCTCIGVLAKNAATNKVNKH